MARRKPELAVQSTRLLSERGSTRATAYSGTNKIVTRDGRTHVAWLDSISDTMVATYHRSTDSWSGPVKVGNGTDNHGGPALTCDSEGRLHIFFGPHGEAPFLHYRSAKPNDASQWDKLAGVGANATYPSAVCDDEDTLHMIYRRCEQSREPPFSLIYQQKPRGAGWSAPLILAKAPDDWNGYTCYHHALTIATDNALHIAFNIYYDGRAQAAGHMMSQDRGKTWILADGSPLSLPVKIESNAFFKRTEGALTINNVVCDSKGHPWVSLSLVESDSALRIYHHDGSTWCSLEPDALLSSEVTPGKLDGSGVLSIGQNDRLYLITRMEGHVILLHADSQAEPFHLTPLFPPDDVLPHAGLTLERPTGHHAVEVPFALFSTGEKGPDCFGRGIFHKVVAMQLRASENGVGAAKPLDG